MKKIKERALDRKATFELLDIATSRVVKLTSLLARCKTMEERIEVIEESVFAAEQDKKLAVSLRDRYAAAYALRYSKTMLKGAREIQEHLTTKEDK